MNTRLNPFILAVLVLQVLFGFSRHALAEQPNVVLIMTDDQGYGDFGFMGNQQIETPNLDQLASESIVFKKFYVSPVCSPTRACLMTGRYNYRTRVVDTFAGRSMMDPDEKTMAEYFRELNYRTGIFGKWHLGDCYPMRPIDQGFEVSVVHRGGGIGQSSDPLEAEGRYTNPTLQVNGVEKSFRGYCTDIYFEQAKRFISESVAKNKPFFVYIADNCPHSPFRDVPEDWLATYKQKGPLDEVPEKQLDQTHRIFSMISNTDRNIGELRDHLDRSGVANNTIFVFLTDNGPNGKRFTCGLRGQKTSVYEGGIRTPLLFHWPAKVAQSVEVQSRHAHIDLLPTLLDCVSDSGLPENLDGRSFLPALSDPNYPFEPRTLFIQTHRGNTPIQYHHFAAIRDNWKLVHASGFHKLNFNGTPKFELYDLENDPRESNDLSSEHPQRVQELKRQYEAWFESVGSERENNFDVPRIVIKPGLEPIVLTRQDLRAPDGERPFPEESGWWINVTEEALVDVDLYFKGSPIGQQAKLQVGNRSFTVPYDSETGRAKISSMRLSQGASRLGAFVEQPSKKKHLVYHVVLTPSKQP